MITNSHDQDICDDSVIINNQPDKDPKERNGKEILTKLWVEQQLVETDSRSVNRGKGLRDHNTAVMESHRANKAGNGERLITNHQNKLLHRQNADNSETLERQERGTELEIPHKDNHVITDISGVLLRKKIEDIHLPKEALKLPLLSKSPLISPTGSPFASPRSSIYTESDSSANSSPANSPSHSPRGKAHASLPRNFAQFKDEFNKSTLFGTRSLPGSPVIRRARTQRSSERSASSMRRQVSTGSDLDHETDQNIGNRSHSFSESKDQRLLSASARFYPRRPGTPVTHDLRPGVRIGLSKSMSDLQAIDEKSSEMGSKRERILPSIFIKN